MKSRAQSNANLKITMLLPTLLGSGAVAMMLNLAEGLQIFGHDVELLVTDSSGERATRLPNSVPFVDLRVSRPILGVPAIVRYLRARQPDILVATEHYSGLPALYATILANGSTRCVIRQDNTWSLAKQFLYGRHRLLTSWMVGYLFRYAEIIAVSQGVADDLLAYFENLRRNISVIYNPVISKDLSIKSSEPLDHPWYVEGSPPVIVAVGRLVKEKGFDVLIDAFAHIVQSTPARLLILGTGPEGPALALRITERGLRDCCQLVGYQQNPYPYIARAAVFALSSSFEGLPTVLIEALSLGTPVVATDCISGPREILANGEFGTLVPVNDSLALAVAITQKLSAPSNVDPRLTEWLQNFSIESSTLRHIELFEASLTGLPPSRRKGPLGLPPYSAPPARG